MSPEELQNRAIASLMLIELRKLSKMQLGNMGLCVAFGQDPTQRDWYPAMSEFFTEQKGTKMHSMTESIFYNLHTQVLEGGDVTTETK